MPTKKFEVVLCDSIMKPLAIIYTASSISSAVGFLATSDFKVATGLHIVIRNYDTQVILRIYRIQSMCHFENVFTTLGCE